MASDQQLMLTRQVRAGPSSLSRTARQTVPAFLQKLYEMVNDPGNEDLIRWSDAGDSFFVLDHERFAREVLGRWFKHQNFSSFVRQLNMYGFHKIPHLQQGVLKSEHETELWNFEHPNFLRAQPDLLCLIQRKKQANVPGGADEGAPTPPAAAAAVAAAAAAELHGGVPAGAGAPAPAGPQFGQVLDVHSIVNGFAAVKRHQTALSADLSELKRSNTQLWQEALAARERHKKHQDTINRILKFLAGVFGHAEPGREPGADRTPPVAIPRKRQRLMIEDGAGGDVKGKRVAVEEVEDDDEIMRHPTPLSSERFATIETPGSSALSPSVAPSELFSPTGTEASTPHAHYPFPHSSSSTPVAAAAPGSSSTSTAPARDPASSALAQFVPQSGSPPPDALQATLSQLLNSPAHVQRLLQAFQAQPAFPLAPPGQDVEMAHHQEQGQDAAMLPPHGAGTFAGPHQLMTLDPHWEPPQVPESYSFFAPSPGAPLSALPSTSTAPAGPNLPPNLNLNLNLNRNLHLHAPSLAMLPAADADGDGDAGDDDDAPLADALRSSDAQLQKTYASAAEVSTDVDALEVSINSLIASMGLDPSAVGAAGAPLVGGGGGAEQGQGQRDEHHGQEAGAGVGMDGQQMQMQPDFDFDAFLSAFTPRGLGAEDDGGVGGGAAGPDYTHAFADKLARGDADGEGAATEHLAFLDEVASQASNEGGAGSSPVLAPSLGTAPGAVNMNLPPRRVAGRKRKSDAGELGLGGGLSGLAQKTSPAPPVAPTASTGASTGRVRRKK